MIVKLKQKWWLASLMAVFFGLIILFLSLLASSPAYYAQNQDAGPSSGRRWQFYIGQEILPDHVFYPLKVAAERTKMFFLCSVDQNYYRLTLAQKRAKSAVALDQRNRPDLAFLTANKSHSYLVEGVNFLVNEKNRSLFSDEEFRFQLRLAQQIVRENRVLFEKITPRLNDDSKARLGVIIKEEEIITQQLLELEG